MTFTVYRELGRHGAPCRHCKNPKPTMIVRVRGGQEITLGGRPFQVAVESDFERCLRCGAFFLEKSHVEGARQLKYAAIREEA